MSAYLGVRRFDAAFFLFFVASLVLQKKEGKKAASNRRTPRSLLLWRYRRRRIFGRAAVPKRGDVLRVPALPRLAEIANDVRVLVREIVLLADVFRQIE